MRRLVFVSGRRNATQLSFLRRQSEELQQARSESPELEASFRTGYRRRLSNTADKIKSAGASAVKVKRVLLLNAPWGLRLLIRFVRLFLSKKIRSRFRVTTEAKMAETVGGWSQIPSNRLAGCGSCADRVVELVQSSTRTPASTGGGPVHVGDGNDGGGGESTKL